MTSATSAVATFLDGGHYFVAKNFGAGFTHILSDGYKGGCVHVPLTEEHLFLAAYGTDVHMGQALYVNEQRSAVFRMFFDLDLFLVADEGPQVWRGVLLVINDAMRTFYPGFGDADAEYYFTCIVLDTPAKPQKGTEVKRGFHLIYPFLFVDQQQALFLREHVVRRLTLLDETRAYEIVERKLKARVEVAAATRAFQVLSQRRAEEPAPAAPLPCDRPLMEGLPQAAQPWAKIIDANVYRATGLRMPHSAKCSKCSVCRNHPPTRAGCTACQKLGKCYSQAVYTVQTAVLGDAALTEAAALQPLIKNPFTRILLTSIRWAAVLEARKHLPPGPEEHGLLNGVPLPNAHFQAPSSMPLPRGVSCAPDGTLALSKIKRRHPVELPRGAEAYSVLRNVIRTRVHDAYRDLEVLDIYGERRADRPEYVVRVQGPGMAYCQNVARDHHSASIFFKVTAHGVAQRCFCRCDTTDDRRSMRRCADYTSPCVPLLNSEMAIVYPGLQASGVSAQGSVFTKRTPPAPVQTVPGLVFRRPADFREGLSDQIRVLQGLLGPAAAGTSNQALAASVQRAFKRQRTES